MQHNSCFSRLPSFFFADDQCQVFVCSIIFKHLTTKQSDRVCSFHFIALVFATVSCCFFCKIFNSSLPFFFGPLLCLNGWSILLLFFRRSGSLAYIYEFVLPGEQLPAAEKRSRARTKCRRSCWALPSFPWFSHFIRKSAAVASGWCRSVNFRGFRSGKSFEKPSIALTSGQIIVQNGHLFSEWFSVLHGAWINT